MPNERNFEDVLARYPELIEAGLRLIGRQVSLYGGRCDLLFEDAFHRRLLIELKWGPIRDEHVGQILRYVGSILSGDNPDLRVMLIGNRVPVNIGRSLDHLGIAWRQINRTDILQFVKERDDVEFISVFDSDDDAALNVPGLERRRKIGPVEPKHALGHPEPHPTGVGLRPALLAVVEQASLNGAFEAFKNGRTSLLLGVGTALAKASNMPISTVYFKSKVRPGETPAIVAKAKLLEITDVNRPQERLAGFENELWKFYYSFKDLSRLSEPIPLSSLRRYPSGKTLRNDAPGTCLVEELADESL
jgi:hypothetical protein